MQIQIDDLETLIANHSEIIPSRCACGQSWPCYSNEKLLAEEVKELRLANGNLRVTIAKLNIDSKAHRKEQANVRKRKQLSVFVAEHPDMSQQQMARRLGFSQSWVNRHMVQAMIEREQNG